MTDSKRISSLAVIGMDTTFPGGEGLAGFGQIIYRGLPLQGKIEDETPLKIAANRTAQRAMKDALMTGDHVSVITLSPDLDGVLTTCLMHHQSYDASTALNPLLAALAIAQDWLEDGKVGEVLMLESQAAPQTISAVVLSLHDSAIRTQKHIYAVISGTSKGSALLNGSSVGDDYRAAMERAGIHPEMVGLIITASLTSSGLRPLEAQAMLSAYRGIGEQSCALSGGASGLLGLIKTAWCLFKRVIPGTPDWKGPLQPELWQKSAFYVPAESRTWFCSSLQKTRYATYHMAALDGSISQIFLKEETSDIPRPNDALKHESFYLFPVAAESINQLVAKITDLQNRVLFNSNFAAAAHLCYDQFMLDKSAAKVQSCLLAHTAEELIREIGFAVTGIATAYEKKSDWQTPLGSYFTAQPLGETGSVAFVYSGAFNSYPGVGQDLFYLFPNLYDRLYALSHHMDELLNEKMLYPRSITALTPTNLNEFETRLTADPMTMLISGTSLAVLYTFLLRDVFALQAANAFGYSLGEISMMFAGNVWTAADEVSAALRASPLFQTRLAGPQNAVRNYWNIPVSNQQETQETVWENYLLMVSPEKVRAVLAGEPRVYLTHINTPRQVVIGGDPTACHRVIESLKCSSLKAPFNYALHNIAIFSEQDAMAKLLSWPVNQQPEMALYSAASCQPLQIDTNKIAHQIANVLCTCLDFPHLIQQVYQDGSRIFIELGAGSNCARWIDDSLNGQPHAAFSIDRKGVDDYSSILRLLARLTCHRTSVNLSLLYN